MARAHEHTKVFGHIPNIELGPGGEMAVKPLLERGGYFGDSAAEGDYDALGGVQNKPRSFLGQPEGRLKKLKETKAGQGCADVIRTARDGSTVGPGQVKPFLDPLKLFKEGVGGNSKNKATAGATLDDPDQN